MPITRNALIRYQCLDQCFRNPGKNFCINDLLESCNNALRELNPDTEGIKKRQLYEDIRFMESSQGWSIQLDRYKEGRKTYFRYEDRDFSINNQPINELEAEQLKSALLILKRFKGLPQFNWINEILPKLDQSFGLTTSSENIISFDNNEFLKGIEFIDPLFNAILYQKVLLIKYQSFRNPEPVEVVFHPWHLKEYNNRWFLFGKSGDFENLTNLALDRILGITEKTESYIESTVDFQEYFDDFIGVTKEPGDIQKIKFWASLQQAPYIKTKPLHASQKRIVDDGSGYTFSIEVIPNYELERLILSFGESLKVIEPIGLKEKIKNRLNENLANY
ncbi:helix-turn-helix transcriptional regulator [Flavimarina sp. Hel_I_48]|uniref:helix-turn-helix transcriptional regulator n=1 Tax=Flavimarina sp. Hel_I_48 TaxID=1392488 RepID=UPI0004DF5EE4|nr:WYL domain-containing protein [Flavimarina sp. Hel_I_48]